MRGLDRRQPRTDPARLALPVGHGRAESDVQSTARYQEQQLDTRRWELYQGSIIVSLPQLGWHGVAIEGLGGLVRAQACGVSDVWGSQETRALQPGTSVLVGVQPKSSRAVVLGNVVNEVSAPGYDYIQQSFGGSWSGLNRDVAADQYTQLVDKATHVVAYAMNPLWDQHAGDWGCRTNMGITVLVDNLSICLATDETTEFRMDLIDQSINLQSRRMQWISDGLAIHDDYLGDVFVMGMGKSAWRGDSDLVASRVEGTTHRDSLAGWVYDFVDLDSGDQRQAKLTDLGYCRQIVMAEGTKASTTHYGPSQLDSSPLGIHWITAKELSLGSDLPGYYQYHEPVWLQEKPTDTLLQVMARNGVAALSSAEDLPGYLQFAEQFVGHYRVDLADRDQYGYRQTFSTYLSEGWLGDSPSQPSNTATYAEAMKKYESFALMRQMTEEPYYCNPVASPDYHLSCLKVNKETGDICLQSEQGAGIRISGGSVFIEGLQVRIHSTKDTVVLGRDLQLLADRNVTVTTNEHLRLYSAKNIAILSGTSGSGGTLIENRSSGSNVELPADPEEAVYSGIAIKSTKAQTAILGGGVLLKAGDRDKGISGDLVLAADVGSMYMSSLTQIVQHSAGRIVQSFGANREQADSVNSFSQGSVVFDSVLRAKDVWSDGSVTARSNVQAITGRLGDSQGQTPGKVTPEGRALAMQGFSQFSQDVGAVKVNANQTYSILKAAYFDSQRPLHSDVVAQLSSGFARPASTSSAYNVTTLQTTYQQEFRTAMAGAPIRNFRFLEVQYKPDDANATSPTFSWPGQDVKAYRARTSGEARLGALVRAWTASLGAVQVGKSEREKVTAAELFQVMREEVLTDA